MPSHLANDSAPLFKNDNGQTNPQIRERDHNVTESLRFPPEEEAVRLALLLCPFRPTFDQGLSTGPFVDADQCL